MKLWSSVGFRLDWNGIADIKHMFSEKNVYIGSFLTATHVWTILWQISVLTFVWTTTFVTHKNLYAVNVYIGRRSVSFCMWWSISCRLPSPAIGIAIRAWIVWKVNLVLIIGCHRWPNKYSLQKSNFVKGALPTTFLFSESFGMFSVYINLTFIFSRVKNSLQFSQNWEHKI